MPAQPKFSKRPLYLQVRDRLAQRIARGEWKPGSMLPSEDELAREVGVSIGTMRKALDGLEEERLVLRRQGRGTTVVDQASEANLNRFNKVTDESGHPIGGDIEMLRQTTRRADEIEQARLRLDASQIVVRTERLRRERGRPLMYEEASLALARLPGLDAADIGNYRLLALAQRSGVRLAWANEQVSMAKATPPVAKLLDVRLGSPLLKLDRVVFTDDEQPVEWRLGLCHLPGAAAYAASMK
jgi:GntR family transcriptional regulator